MIESDALSSSLHKEINSLEILEMQYNFDKNLIFMIIIGLLMFLFIIFLLCRRFVYVIEGRFITEKKEDLCSGITGCFISVNVEDK